MLRSLSIRDIVLIERLDLGFAGGLCVLTGETGAGKSILLDSLGLALGRRADRVLVRTGCDRGVVSAEFTVDSRHPVWSLLADQGLADQGQDGGRDNDVLVLRRVVSADGKSRAFVNDQAVGIGLLADVGDCLVEIHGQHDDRGLLNARRHRTLLDAFGGLGAEVVAVREAHGALATIRAARGAEETALAAARADEEYLRHNLDELAALAPEAGEEETLSARRTL
ncbi:MAG: AAA family ATPase, partial [Sphingomonadales bacterium]